MRPWPGASSDAQAEYLADGSPQSWVADWQDEGYNRAGWAGSDSTIMIIGISLIVAAIVIGFMSYVVSTLADKSRVATTEPWQAWAASIMVLVAFFCFGAGGFLACRALQAREETMEAHRMLCGTPDCTRNSRICGKVGLEADQVDGLGDDGGTVLGKQACCRDLMMRMLVDVGAFLDKHNIEWYITFGTLLGALRNNDIIVWTDDLDIAVPNAEDQELLRTQTEIPYRFGRYGGILRGAPDYPNVTKKLPHHPSGNGAHMWVNDFTPLLPFVSCEGEHCTGRMDPAGNDIKQRSHVFPDWVYSGRTSYYFMDVYDSSEVTYKACDAFGNGGDEFEKPRRSTRTVEISGQRFPVHHNAEACLEDWYGSDWRIPTHEHVSDYTTM